MPFDLGSMTPSTALAAMAASMAEPPCSSMRAPACDAGNLAGGHDAVGRGDDGAAVGAVLRSKCGDGEGECGGDESDDGQRGSAGMHERDSPMGKCVR